MRSRSSARHGQTVVLFTLAAIPLFGIMGLAVDLGWTQYRRVAAQSAADAAAMAAALAAYQSAAGGSMLCNTSGISCNATEFVCPSTLPSTPANNIQAGCLYARDNGFVTAGKQKVAFQSGVGAAPTAAGVTTSYWVVARVSERVPQLFSAVLGFPNAMINVSATTGAKEASGGGCVITLDPHASGSISNNGLTSLTSGCGVFVNSDSNQAIRLVGNANITTTGKAKTEIAGNWSGSGNGSITPPPLIRQPPMGDPLADMEPPNIPTTCADSSSKIDLKVDKTIDPGVYCYGFTLGSHAKLTLRPGLYIVKNGIDLGGQSDIEGSGVTIYIESGGVSMAGGTTASLTAPSSGYYQGILFFQKRGNATQATLVGTAAQQMNGALYFPSAHLRYTGGSQTAATATTIIANTLELNGHSSIRAAATTRFTGNQGGVSLIQ